MLYGGSTSGDCVVEGALPGASSRRIVSLMLRISCDAICPRKTPSGVESAPRATAAAERLAERNSQLPTLIARKLRRPTRGGTIMPRRW